MVLAPLVALVLAVKGPPVLSGTVLDERGRPAAGVDVQGAFDLADTWDQRTSTRTGPDGRFVFRLGDVGAGKPSRVLLAQAQALATGGRSSELVRAARFPGDVTLRLRPAARLVARIEAEGGELPAKLHVRIVNEWRSRVSPAPGLDAHPVDLEAPVEQGRITLDGLVPGVARVVIHEEPYRFGVARVRLAPGRTTTAHVVLGRPGGLRLELVGGEEIRFYDAECDLEPGEPYDALFAQDGTRATAQACFQLLGRYTQRLDLIPGEQQLTIILKDGRVYRRRFVVRPNAWCWLQDVDVDWRNEGLRSPVPLARMDPDERVALASSVLREAPLVKERTCGEPPPPSPPPQPVYDPPGPPPSRAGEAIAGAGWLLPCALAAFALWLTRRAAAAADATLRRGARAAAALALLATACSGLIPYDPKIFALFLSTLGGLVAVALAWGARGSRWRAVQVLGWIGVPVLAIGLLPLVVWILPAVVRAQRGAIGFVEIAIASMFALAAAGGVAMVVAATLRSRALSRDQRSRPDGN